MCKKQFFFERRNGKPPPFEFSRLRRPRQVGLSNRLGTQPALSPRRHRSRGQSPAMTAVEAPSGNLSRRSAGVDPVAGAALVRH